MDKDYIRDLNMAIYQFKCRYPYIDSNNKTKSHPVKKFIREIGEESYYHYWEMSHYYKHRVYTESEVNFIFDVKFIFEKKDFTENFKEEDLIMKITIGEATVSQRSKITRTVLNENENTIVYSMNNGCTPNGSLLDRLSIECNVKPFTVYYKICKIEDKRKAELERRKSSHWQFSCDSHYIQKSGKYYMFTEGICYFNNIRLERGNVCIYSDDDYYRIKSSEEETIISDENYDNIKKKIEDTYRSKECSKECSSYNPSEKLIVFYIDNKADIWECSGITYFIACYVYDDKTGLYVDEKHLKIKD